MRYLIGTIVVLLCACEDRIPTNPYDPESPSIAAPIITSPTDSSYFRSFSQEQNILITGTASEGLIVTLYVNSIPEEAENIVTGLFSFNHIFDAEGIYTLRVKATDYQYESDYSNEVSINIDIVRLMERYTTADGMVDDNINNIIVDERGNIYLATSGGIAIFKSDTWTSITTANGLLSNYVQAITMNQDGDIIIGTNKGVSIITGSSCTNYTTADGLASNNVRSIATTSDGTIIAGTDAGLSVFEHSSWNNITTVNGLSSNNIYSMYLSPDDNLYLAHWDGGISYSSDPSLQSWTVFSMDDIPAGGGVLAIFADDENIIYVGCVSDMCIYTNSKWEVIPSRSFLGSVMNPSIRDIYKDEQKILYVATDSGLGVQQDSTWHVFNTQDGLLNDIIRDLFVDSTGKIYLGHASYARGLNILY